VNPNRRFVYEILGMGLELECVTPADLIQHVNPEVLAHHLPVSLKAKLIQASLDAERMTPALIVETVGIDALVEHAPLPVLWACVRGSVERMLGSLPERPAATAAAPAPAGGNGSSIADDLALKPPKAARPAILRSSTRISSLSPRSRVIGRREDSSPGIASSAADSSEPRRDEVVHDLAVIEETDLRGGSPRAAFKPGDEGDTRPGEKS
jgi:hypothetical protein